MRLLKLFGTTCVLLLLLAQPAFADTWFSSGAITKNDVNITTAVTTQVATAIGGLAIHSVSGVLIAAGATTITIEEGTGTLCATNLKVLQGPIPMIAGFGYIITSQQIVTDPGQNLCILNANAIQVGGNINTVNAQ